MKKSVLLLDSDPTFCQGVKDYLVSFGHKVTIAHNMDAAIQCIDDNLPSILFLNINLLTIAALGRIEYLSKKINGRVKVVALTHHYYPVDNTAIQLMNRKVLAINRNSPLSEFRYFLSHDKKDRNIWESY